MSRIEDMASVMNALTLATGLAPREVLALRTNHAGDPEGWMDHLQRIAADRGNPIAFRKGGLNGAPVAYVTMNVEKP